MILADLSICSEENEKNINKINKLGLYRFLKKGMLEAPRVCSREPQRMVKC
jgi:hypothetical protein